MEHIFCKAWNNDQHRKDGFVKPGKKIFQKLGTIVNNRNIKQFMNKNKLLVKHYSCKLSKKYYNFDYE